MGLHLNYELRLPASATVEEVGHILVRLRDFALALPFKSVTEISRRGGLRLLASVIAKVFVDDTPPLTADIDLVRGFSVIPGNGCESAAFAFMPRADQRGKHADWFWYSSSRRGTVDAYMVDLEPRREPRAGGISPALPANGEVEDEVVRLAQRV